MADVTGCVSSADQTETNTRSRVRVRVTAKFINSVKVKNAPLFIKEKIPPHSR